MLVKVGTRDVDYTFGDAGILVMNWETDEWEQKDDIIEWAVELLKEEEGFEDEALVEDLEVDFSGNIWLYLFDGGE